MADGPYRIDDGVKRAKAALLLGLPAVRAELRDAQFNLLREFDVPLAGLLSRLSMIDRTVPGVRAKWDRIWHGMRRDPAALPRIVVVRSSRGTPLENVALFPSLTLMPPGPPPAPPPGPFPNPPPPLIAPDRTRAALRALNWLFVHQRNLASDRGDREAESYFDHAEYLPCLMLEPEDQTAFFERYLRSWAGQDAGAAGAYNRYLSELGRESVGFDVLRAEHAAEQEKFRAERGLPAGDARALKDAA